MLGRASATIDGARLKEAANRSLILAASLTLTPTRALAAADATATPTANEAALRALAATHDVSFCAKTSHTTPLAYARRFVVRNVTLAGGTSIVIFEGGCESGNDNDAIYIFAAHGSQPYKLVSNVYGFLEKLTPDGTLTLMSNPGGVSVRYHDTSRWNGTSFEPVSSIVRWESTGESKPSRLPLNFPVGASSATVSGTVRQDFPDVYQLSARPGQHLSVDVRPRSGSIGRLAISIDNGARIIDGSGLSWHGTLPIALHTVTLADGTAETIPGGRYLITVDGADETRATYTMTVTIR